MKARTNTSHHLELISNSGNFRLIADMKVDYYDGFGWGARRWVLYTKHVPTGRVCKMTLNGEILFPENTFSYKKDLMAKIASTGAFSDALSEISDKKKSK